MTLIGKTKTFTAEEAEEQDRVITRDREIG
jgi:hypothetical protein